jgi:hypothetical protein
MTLAGARSQPSPIVTRICPNEVTPDTTEVYLFVAQAAIRVSNINTPGNRIALFFIKTPRDIDG